ncbi:hypothetical protein BK652_26990 [Pseudomonas brassicacearum]|uniref:Uncharacterized protein n=2 Tax=Pseudomonas TaxID=286 RepID=A0A423FTN9_9PSED|nr:hypothetical protein RL74_21530 [Pseudomonas fluorescens]ROM75798.1 hypothetical protein BK652_26990 [Pseudomonas brassicacearum]
MLFLSMDPLTLLTNFLVNDFQGFIDDMQLSMDPLMVEYLNLFEFCRLTADRSTILGTPFLHGME